MQLTNRIDEVLQISVRKHAHLHKLFTQFAATAGNKDVLQGNASLTEANQHVLDVQFPFVWLQFTFYTTYDKNHTIIGTIACTRVWPTFSDQVDVIGKFEFDTNGKTDLEFPDTGDRLFLIEQAPFIVQHFAYLAHRETPLGL